MSFNLNSLNGKSAAGSTVYDGKRFQQTDQATGLFKVHSEPHRLTNLHSMPSPLVHTTYLTHSHTQPKLGTPFATTHNTNGYNIRFAVNGLSKFEPGNEIPAINKNITAGNYGDDSGMVAENSKCIVIGLADGAGGNRLIGIDPQRFSRTLLANCVDLIKREEILPHEMAKLATKSVHLLEKHNIEGSGTLCLLSLNKQTNILHSMNMGDSGFRIMRNGFLVHKSEATMAGSSPKQLYVSYQHNYTGISFVREKDIAGDSDIKQFQVQHGDLIILASDGVFDVVTDNKIEQVVNKRDSQDLQGIADDLLYKARISYIHTKRDDILVMVCRVEGK